MSRTVRKLATSLCRFDRMYIFHFDLHMKSISSCGNRVRGLFSQKFTYSASIHSTARCRCGGHNWKWGRVSHSLGMFTADVRIILAIPSVSSYMCVFLPHTQLVGVQGCPSVRTLCRRQCLTYGCG